MTYLTVKTRSPLDAGYLAGIIDGEGTITLTQRNQNKQRGLVVTVSSTEMSILKYVQEITLTKFRASRRGMAVNILA
ncbi:MAG: LAGLIDADG family homing endonuclease [Nitrospirales bacterium]|nr:LAGLIDADG family homing endonuclease [Nitrospirales bacterium]